MKRLVRWLVVLFVVLLAAVYLAARLTVPPIAEQKVTEVYGTPPFDRASPRARELHRNLLVADLHADALIWKRDLVEHNANGQVDIPRLIEANVAIQFFSVPTKLPRKRSQWGTPADSLNLLNLPAVMAWPPRTWIHLDARALHLARVLHRTAERSQDRFTVIESSEDLDRYLDRRVRSPAITSGVLSIEGLHSLEGELDNLDRFFEEGFRMMGLVHHFDNEVGGSSYGMERGGLTDFGRQVLRKMESLGILIDLAHASPQLIDDVLAVAESPLVVSHTGVRGTCDRRRNLSDQHVLGIAGSGGVVGIGFWSGATCGRDAGAVAQAIRHVADLVGTDHVALGSDFDGDKMPFDVTGVVQITDALLDRGFKADEIAQIMGGNIVRLLRQSLPRP